jgi:hypothetical protein
VKNHTVLLLLAAISGSDAFLAASLCPPRVAPTNIAQDESRKKAGPSGAKHLDGSSHWHLQLHR